MDMTLFGTAGIRGPVRDTVTPELALAVGRAVGESNKTVVVGQDGRETGQALASALEAGLVSSGSDVRRVGQVPTPALAFASRGRTGVMLTASHNPPADNGIKLFDDGVEFDREQEKAIESRVANESTAVRWNEWGSTTRTDVLDAYRNAVIDYVRTQFDSGSAESLLENQTIVVDCGTGVGALATPQILGRLGADVIAINAAIDGYFPARESKPTPESLTDLASFLQNGTSDIGLAHDGDGDRLVVLGPDGTVIHEDTILAVVAAHYTEQAIVEDPVVVTTPNASARIDELVRAAGGRVERVHLGALHEGIARVRAEATPDTAVVFAAEPWKHIHPEFGGWIDAVTSAAVVAALAANAGNTEALREPVTERPYRKVSVDCPDVSKDSTMNALESRLPDEFPEAELDTEYGLRLEFPNGSWILVRPSGTEPYIRVYAESDDVDELVEKTTDVVTSSVSTAA